MSLFTHIHEAMPTAPLKICALPGCEDKAYIINEYLKEYQKEFLEQFPDRRSLYHSGDFLVTCTCDRFGTGEGKGTIKESIRGKDLYLISDITNTSVTYRLRNFTNHMSPDDHYQNLKRIISAANGKAHRINVIMPFMYESRQHKRSYRESLDNALMLQELHNMGVTNIITFDAHDPRTQNAIPLAGFDNFYASYQFLQAILLNYPNLELSSDKLIILSPDEGAMFRAKYMANILGVDLGMFYKRRDFSQVVGGKNPIVAHEYLGTSLEGKTAIIIDDMIASGDSLIKTSKEVMERGAKRAIACTTFGLFTNGFDEFDKAYAEGSIDKVITTNLIYQNPALLKKPWYASANMNKYLSAIIYTLNHDVSLENIVVNTRKINQMLSELGRKQQDLL